MSSAPLVAEVAALLGVAAAEAPALVEAAAGDREAALALAARRVAGAPLALLTGRASFLGLELLAEEGVLAPREETELLAVTAVRLAVAHDAVRVIDVGCGAGNLTCAIAVGAPTVTVYAADITPAAVSLTRRNADRLGVGSRVHTAEGDLFDAFSGLGLEGSIDLVVCNPPYISTGRLGKDRAQLLEHEPREAFDAGPFGIAIQQRVIRDAPRFLKPGGWLALEVGLGQGAQVETLFARSGSYEAPLAEADGNGEVRVVYARHTAG